jgi:hypothetical protein
VSVLGNYAYLSGYYGLVVFDLSNPASPIQAALYEAGDSGGSHIKAVAGRVFVDRNILDVTDPINPSRVGGLFGESFAVVGHHVYAADRANGLRIYHLAHLANPQRLGWLELPDANPDARFAERPLALAGNCAYVSRAFDEPQIRARLHVIDTSDPAAPSSLGAFDNFPTYFQGAMVVLDQHLYVVSRSGVGLRVYDLQDPTQPRLVGHCPLSEYAYTIHIAANHAYVGHWGGYEKRFDIIDVSDPTRPAKVSEWRYPTSEQERGLAVAGDRFYLARYYRPFGSTLPHTTLTILGIDNPRHPQVLGTYEAEGIIRALAISGDYAYMVGDLSFFVVDVSDPRNPRWIGSASPLDYRGGIGKDCIVISGDYAYVACWLGDGTGSNLAVLHVFDIRDPSNPILVGKNSGACALSGQMIIHDGTLYAYGGIGSPALIVYDLYRPPLRLDPPEFLGLDGWRLRLWGGAGQSLRLQRSPDLRIWEDWHTTIGSDLPQEFIDGHAGSRARQFYRAVSP